MKPATQIPTPHFIGRFEVTRELGRGAQGTVFLARDSHLGRQVALKTVRISGYDTVQRADILRTLLGEARIVSRLQHPNLVTLFDAGEHEGAPYLVLEYVEGNTLGRRLRESPVTPAQAVGIAIGVLRGLACAHAMNILHRDIKPGNVMLTPSGDARVMDFGIARHATGGKYADGSLAGTPWYMAPESIANESFSLASDVFAVGAVLYETLTRRKLIAHSDPHRVLYGMLHEEYAPPSQFNPDVDEQLESIVMRALAKRPEERFANADQMTEALEAYLSPERADKSVDGGGTLEFLLRRMRHKSDFPALSTTVSQINRVTLAEHEPVSALCNAILKDVALTSKLLKMVNSVHYRMQGGKISTVSRAVAILGFDAVRSLSMSLLLFDHLKDRAQASALKEQVAASYFSGVIARELVSKLGWRNAEEAFICAMFHRFGQLLVAFYLRDEHQAILRIETSRGWNGTRAAHEVLGMDYEDIGMGVARHWNFPDTIIDSMRDLTGNVASRADFQGNMMRVVASLSNDLCDTARAATPEKRAQGLGAIVRKYGKGTGVNDALIRDVVKSSFDVLARESVVINISPAVAPVLAHAKNWKSPEGTPTVHATPTSDAIQRMVDVAGMIDPAAPPAADTEAAGEERATVLLSGVQDITSMIAGEFQLNDVLRTILETMYTAVRFQRVLLCVSDPKRNALRARLGLGQDVDAIIKSGFALPLNGPPDIFFAATSKSTDICIEDIDAANIRAYVPAWYRKAVPACGVVLFPLVLKGHTVGLIYADTDRPGCLKLTPEELNLLRTLRNQALLALKQAG